MKFALDIAQLVVALLLIASILIQAKNGGLGTAFGGSETIASTRRGAEKGIFILSIIFATLFIGLAVAQTLLA